MPVLVCPLIRVNDEFGNFANLQAGVLHGTTEENARNGALAVASIADLTEAVSTLRSEITQGDITQNINLLDSATKIDNKFSQTTLTALQKLPADVKELLKPLLVAELKSYIDQKFDELREQLVAK